MKRSTKLKVIKIASEKQLSIEDTELFLIKEAFLGNLKADFGTGFNVFKGQRALRGAVNSGVVDPNLSNHNFNLNTRRFERPGQPTAMPTPVKNFGNMSVGQQAGMGAMALGAGKMFMDSQQKRKQEEEKNRKKAGGPIIIQS